MQGNAYRSRTYDDLCNERWRRAKESGCNYSEGEGPRSTCYEGSEVRETMHMQSARKAQAVLGMVKRHFKELDKEDFMVIYKAYIRPHLEYCVHCASVVSTFGQGQRLPRTNSKKGDKTC